MDSSEPTTELEMGASEEDSVIILLFPIYIFLVFPSSFCIYFVV